MSRRTKNRGRSSQGVKPRDRRRLWIRRVLIAWVAICLVTAGFYAIGRLYGGKPFRSRGARTSQPVP